MWNNDSMENTNENWKLSNLENLSIVIMNNPYLDDPNGDGDGWVTIRIEDQDGQVRTEMRTISGRNCL